MIKIPLSRPFVNDEIREAALRALYSGRYILDQECERFEIELAEYVGTSHAVLSSSWTAAVLLLHEAMGLREGDEVLVPSLTAFPTVEPMLHCGAKPIFVDVNDTLCIDPHLLERAITSRTVGILPVHLHGHLAEMDPILDVARRFDLWVLEDCAQALGARYHGRRVGTFGVGGGFSFYPSKNLTVLGDGGCICTDDDLIANRLRMLRNHGRRGKYVHELVGFNLRFNEIQAAIGRVALRHLESLNQARIALAAHYDERLRALVTIPQTTPGAEPVYHIYSIRTPRRDQLALYLARSGVETGIHFPIPIHQQPVIGERFGQMPKLPRTERLVGELLSLPLFPELTIDEVDFVCDRVVEFFAAHEHPKP
jgi:dTDP-4-amino-4,6-dideoxygalactose transaminase